MFEKILPVLIGALISLIGAFLGIVYNHSLDRKKNLKEQAQYVGTYFQSFYNRLPLFGEYFSQQAIENKIIDYKELADFLYPKELNDLKIIIPQYFKDYEPDLANFIAKWHKYANAYLLRVSSVNKINNIWKVSQEDKKINLMKEIAVEIEQMSSITFSIYKEKNGCFAIFNKKVVELLDKYK